MTPEQVQQLLPTQPVDGHVIEYWRIEGIEGTTATHLICRYDVNTAWHDHPWGRSGERNGADFEDDWSIWVEYPSTPGIKNPSGRIGGWSSLRAVIAKPDIYAAEAEAIVALVHRKEQRIETLNEEIKRHERQLSEIRRRWQDVTEIW